MKQAFILLIASCSFCCSDSDVEHQSDSIGYFEQHLDANMNYENLKSTFGDPDDDIGSGIHIYQYNLADGTRILIGFVDKILYARQVDVNGQVIKVLI